jgi:hypothetical protein
MNRRHLIAGLCAGLLIPQAAWAQNYADRIVRQLRAQGYTGITVSNTWLGRTRIVAQSADGSREIIIDPRTGEILRDLWQGGGAGQSIVNDTDRAEDDRDDDSGSNSGSDGDSDNSGHGSSDDDDDSEDDDGGDDD